MLKKSIIALAAVLLAAAPALASTDSVFGTNDYNQLDVAKAAIAQQLHQRGIDVVNVDEWDGYVRADVKLADGTQVARYFTAGNLQPVALTDLN
jgi:hypothetical protein